MFASGGSPLGQLLFPLHKNRAVLGKVPDFLDLKGSVPVAPGKKGSSWSKIRAETWRKRTAKRH